MSAMALVIVGLVLSVLVGVSVMSLPRVRPEVNLLSEFVLAIFGALGLGLPIAIAIIWICS